MATKEREQLKQVHPNKKWVAKVEKMTDAQVSAMYTRLKAQGKL